MRVQLAQQVQEILGKSGVCPTFYTWRFEQGFASHDAHGGRCGP